MATNDDLSAEFASMIRALTDEEFWNLPRPDLTDPERYAAHAALEQEVHDAATAYGAVGVTTMGQVSTGNAWVSEWFSDPSLSSEALVNYNDPQTGGGMSLTQARDLHAALGHALAAHDTYRAEAA